MHTPISDHRCVIGQLQRCDTVKALANGCIHGFCRVPGFLIQAAFKFPAGHNTFFFTENISQPYRVAKTKLPGIMGQSINTDP